jgi:hypothetical protein
MQPFLKLFSVQFNMRVFKLNKWLNAFFFLVFLIAAVNCIRLGVVFFPDSDGYMNVELFRSCGYPIFLSLHKLFFGAFYLKMVVFSQFVIIFYAVFHFLNTVQQFVLKNVFFIGILFLILLMPLFYEFNLPNTILSESISYPLYLLVLSNLFHFIQFKTTKQLLFSILIAIFLMLTRGQFLFLTVVFLIVFIIFHKIEVFKKRNLMIAIFIFLIPFLITFIDVAYHKIVHNRAVTTPWTGVQIATMPFFLSNSSDVEAFDDPVEKEYFNFVYQKLFEKKILQSQMDPNLDQMDYFKLVYPLISNFTINPDGEAFFKNVKTLDEKAIQNDKFSSKMFLPLVQRHPFEFAKLYIKNLGYGFGNTKYFLLFMIFLAVSFWFLIKKSNQILWFIFVICLCGIGNVMLVSIAETCISRYCFYNNWVLIAVFLVLLQDKIQISRPID